MINVNSRVENNRRSFKPLLLFLVVIVIVFGATASYLIIKKNDKALFEEAAANFIRILENKDYKNLGKALDEHSYKSLNYTLEEVEEKYDRIFNGINITDIHASHVSLEKVNNNLYELSYQLSFTTPLGALEKLEYKTEMTKKDDKYLVNWEPALIFPGMEGKDKISYQYLKAERGEIQDHLGNGLAINETFKSMGVVAKELGEGNEKEAKLQKISQQFDLSMEEINKKLNQSWVTDELFVPLKTIESNKAVELPGVSYQNIKLRYYPLKEAAANLIGYIGKVTKEDNEKHPNLVDGDIIGKAGLEKAFDKRLRGKDGGEIWIVDENGENKQEIQTVEKADGEDIQLTIDSYIQSEAFEHLKGNAGSTVVMNPKEGGLFALVSSPSYDPNKMVQGISQQDYDQYANDEKKPFISRFAVGYAPGSTFKTITASIGLDANVTYPDKLRTINGRSWKKDGSWGGYSVTRVSDVQNVDMRKALIYSDNIYFAQEVLELGEDAFRDGLKKFIFGEELDLPIAMNPAQISKENTFNSEILLADTAYGQGELLINPIQQAVMYTVFQNEGKIFYPTLVKSKESPKTKSAITSTTANEMEKSLIEVVSNPNGTAHLLYNKRYQLAAKTGTAELKLKQGEKGNENSFLLAFDTEQDNFLLLSLVEGYSKGSSATQLNKSFIEKLYVYFGMQ